jgi:hypothetical protein
VNSKEETLKTFVPITSKNSASRLLSHLRPRIRPQYLSTVDGYIFRDAVAGERAEPGLHLPRPAHAVGEVSRHAHR